MRKSLYPLWHMNGKKVKYVQVHISRSSFSKTKFQKDFFFLKKSIYKKSIVLKVYKHFHLQDTCLWAACYCDILYRTERGNKENKKTAR